MGRNKSKITGLYERGSVSLETANVRSAFVGAGPQTSGHCLPRPLPNPTGAESNLPTRRVYLSRPAARSVSRATVPQVESFSCLHSRSLRSSRCCKRATRERNLSSLSSAMKRCLLVSAVSCLKTFHLCESTEKGEIGVVADTRSIRVLSMDLMFTHTTGWPASAFRSRSWLIR